MVVGWCFTKPRNYLQISTDIFIFDRGYVFLRAVRMPGVLRPGSLLYLSCATRG